LEFFEILQRLARPSARAKEAPHIRIKIVRAPPQTLGLVGPLNVHRKRNLALETLGAPVETHFAVQLVSHHPPYYACAEADV
jgi:hypothetical protein